MSDADLDGGHDDLTGEQRHIDDTPAFQPNLYFSASDTSGKLVAPVIPTAFSRAGAVNERRGSDTTAPSVDLLDDQVLGGDVDDGLLGTAIAIIAVGEVTSSLGIRSSTDDEACPATGALVVSASHRLCGVMKHSRRVLTPWHLQAHT